MLCCMLSKAVAPGPPSTEVIRPQEEIVGICDRVGGPSRKAAFPGSLREPLAVLLLGPLVSLADPGADDMEGADEDRGWEAHTKPERAASVT